MRSLTCLLMVIAVSSCCRPLMPDPPPDFALQCEIACIRPELDPLVARTPVFDIHIHAFNSRYLPLEGILLGKRDKLAPISWLLSDRCAKTVAKAVVDLTPPVEGSGVVEVDPALHRHRGGIVCNKLIGLLERALEKGCWDESIAIKERMDLLSEVVNEMNYAEVLAARAAATMMGFHENVNHRPHARRGLESFVKFIWVLTQDDSVIADIYRAEHGISNLRYVYHNMDLGPVYDQTPSATGMVDYQSVQIRRAHKLTTGRDRWFVAYNPFRDHWNGGQHGDGLRIVRDAVQKRGAAGIKIYPPSGYRVSGNAIKERPFALRSDSKRQWDARYPGSVDETNRRLDRQLEELLLWCIKHDIPVFTHCSDSEFEARKGYGAYHSDPKFWQEFLEKHPEPDGSPCRLRLCFGHAGTHDFWFGGCKRAEWGMRVYEMCIKYPNVYCEVTTSGELTEPATQAFFAARLACLFRESDNASYPFQYKILYGTDWPLPASADAKSILRGARQVFLSTKLRPYFSDYFHRNAERYLGERGSGASH